MTQVIDLSKYVYEPVDLCTCYDPIFFPSEAQVKEWERLRTERNNPFHGIVEKRIGNTWYLIETVCDGNEALADLARRLIFSKEEALCS